MNDLWQDIPKVVAGNKWDLENQRVINEKEFKDFSEGH